MSLADKMKAAQDSKGYWKELCDLLVADHVRDAARLALLEKVAEAARDYKARDDRRWETGEYDSGLRDAWLVLDASLKQLEASG